MMAWHRANRPQIQRRQSQNSFVPITRLRRCGGSNSEYTRARSDTPCRGFHHGYEWNANSIAGITKSQSDTALQVQKHYSVHSDCSDNRDLTRRMVPNASSILGIQALPSNSPDTEIPSTKSLPETSDSKVQEGDLSTKSSQMSIRGYNQREATHVGLEDQDNPITFILSTDLLWQQIQGLRVENWSLRSRIHELRTTLRKKQIAKSDADDLLLQSIRKQQLLGLETRPNTLVPGGKTISNLMEDCQVARDEYGPAEDDCNRLEDQLSGQEFRLAGMEEEFYRRPKEPAASEPEQLGNPAFRGTSRLSTTSLDGINTIDYHPLVNQFLSRLGDLDLLRESLDELLEEKESLEEEQILCRQAGHSLAEEDQIWLDNCQTEEAKFAEDIKTAENDVKSMREDCLLRGLIDEEGHPTDFPSQEQVSFNGEDVNPKDEISEYVKYPLLLPHPGIKQKSLEGYNPKPQLDSASTITRINQWMLDRLRTSALDVRLLASTFEGSCGEINDRWQDSVLSVWYSDGTFDGEAGIRVYTNSMTTRATTPSKESPDSLRNRKDYNNERGHFTSSSRLPSERSDATQIPSERMIPELKQSRQQEQVFC